MMKIRSLIRVLMTLFLVLAASSCAGAIETSDLRLPYDDEMFYHYVAAAINEPQFCEKISPQAYLTAGWGGEGSQISLERSRCYFDTATRFGQTDLCQKVVPISTKTLDGRRYSPARCREEIKKYGPIKRTVNQLPAHKALITIFSRMGYDYATVIQQKLTPNPLNLFDVYIKLAEKKDIVPQIQELLNSPAANNLNIQQREILDDLAAHTANDIEWCQKIRQDALTPDSHYFKNTSQESFHDRCIFEIASNTRNPVLCQKMPDRPVDLKKAVSLKEQCLQQAGGERYGQKIHYGHFVPEDEQVIAELLKALNHPLPKAQDLSEAQLAKVYIDFLLSLSFPEQDNLYYEKAKAEFVRRLQSLADFK